MNDRGDAAHGNNSFNGAHQPRKPRVDRTLGGVGDNRFTLA